MQGKGLTRQIRRKIALSDGQTPLDYLLAVMQDEEAPDKDRISCAIAAAPYVHPRLASVELKGDKDKPLQVATDIGTALQALAEMARQREPVIDLLPADVRDVT